MKMNSLKIQKIHLKNTEKYVENTEKYVENTEKILKNTLNGSNVHLANSQFAMGSLSF